MVLTRSIFWIAFFIMLLFSAAAPFGGPVAFADGGVLQVVVKNDVQVTGERILLGQISEISGGSGALRQAVFGIDLGPAPRPGQARRITGNSVAVQLSNIAGAGVKATIPGQVQVRGAFQQISEASLEAAFRQYVMNGVGEDEVDIRRIAIRGVKPLPPGKISLTPSDAGRDEIKGKTSLRIAVTVDGEDCGQVTVSGWVDRYARVVCAARSIPRHTVLSAEDLCFERINIARAPDRLIFDTAEAVGKRVRSTVQTGKYLQQHKLFEVPLVEKGDRVKLLVSAGPVNISTLGVAKTDGGAGDQIRVENLSSEKMVMGRVVDNSTVEVLF
jgi:flagella basal body P-ring formation protein FlgA